MLLASGDLGVLGTVSADASLLSCPCLPANERLYGATVTFSALFAFFCVCVLFFRAGNLQFGTVTAFARAAAQLICAH